MAVSHCATRRGLRGWQSLLCVSKASPVCPLPASWVPHARVLFWSMFDPVLWLLVISSPGDPAWPDFPSVACCLGPASGLAHNRSWQTHSFPAGKEREQDSAQHNPLKREKGPPFPLTASNPGSPKETLSMDIFILISWCFGKIHLF